MLTSELIRAARALLRWTQQDLATNASISLPTIKRLEGTGDAFKLANSTTLDRIQKTFEAQNIEFLNSGSPGVRLKE